MTILLLSVIAEAQEKETTRDEWLYYMDKVARPVFSNLAADNLREKIPVMLLVRIDNPEQHKKVAYLEAFARTLSGISPWLISEGGSPKEITLRIQYRD
jgi:hypothetical protein